MEENVPVKKKKLTFFQIVKLIFKRMKLSTLLLIAITIACNTFAWFLYATEVSTGVKAHVKAWNVLFTSNDNTIEEYVQFVIPSIYPGMETFQDSIKAFNRGEHGAKINYEIVEAKILGVSYRVDGVTLTSDMLANKLAGDFPFSINLELSNDMMNASSGVSTFSIDVSWPYESGDDSVDTYWGNKSYEYSSNNPGEDSIVLNIKISAVQEQA